MPNEYPAPQIEDINDNYVLELTDRESAQIDHALDYAENFSQAGVPGASQFMLIAKLARALNL